MLMFIFTLLAQIIPVPFRPYQFVIFMYPPVPPPLESGGISSPVPSSYGGAAPGEDWGGTRGPQLIMIRDTELGYGYGYGSVKCRGKICCFDYFENLRVLLFMITHKLKSKIFVC
jgi:hypothetical protein